MSTHFLYSDDSFFAERFAIRKANESLSGDIIIRDHSEFVNLDLGFRSLFDEKRTFIILNASLVDESKLDGNDYFFVLKKYVDDPRVVSLPPLKVSNNRNDVIDWIIDEGKTLNIDLSKVASALFVNSGIRLRKIYSEIQKISEMVNPGSTVEFSDIRDIIVFSGDLTPKELTNSIINRRSKTAFSLYDKLQVDDSETGWIVSYLQNEFSQIFSYGYMKKSGVDDDSIADSMGINRWVLSNFVIPNYDRPGVANIRRHLGELNSIEIDHKSGSGNAEFRLLNLIYEITSEAGNGKR